MILYCQVRVNIASGSGSWIFLFHRCARLGLDYSRHHFAPTARADLGMSQRNQTVCYETVQPRPKMGVC